MLDETVFSPGAWAAGTTFFLLALGYFVGRIAERRHYESILRREAATSNIPAVAFRTVPAEWSPTKAALVTGSVVISVDYFKTFLAGLRSLVGGRLRTYETLLDRGRREAVLRLKEAALAQGFNAVIAVRLETSAVAGAGSNQGTAGVEILAYGTALKI